MRVQQDIFTGVNRICWLCVLIELMSDMLPDKSLENAPLILSGMNSIYEASQIQPYRQAIFNVRQIVHDFITESSIRKAVNIYNDYHYQERTQGLYNIDPETLKFERVDFLEDPAIIKAKQILNHPLAYAKHNQQVADPSQQMAINLGDKNIKILIPIEPIKSSLIPRKTHEINRSPQGKITIPLRDLQNLAEVMDKREQEAPERKPENWVKRLNFQLMTTEIEQKLEVTETLELEGIKHLLGLPGSGKTTILMLIATWLGYQGYKALFLFPSIEVARQYYSQLKFHQVNVGMLVGNSDNTRRRHADKLAESIAIASENNGFAKTIEGAELFGLNCVLPAFTKQDTSLWQFGQAHCSEILQGTTKKGNPQKNLCPLWTMCGRNKSPRDLINANIWVGHILSMDTDIPYAAIDEKIRYFEFIARTFDLIVFDEADMVQSLLDSYGAATLNISGAKDSLHRVTLEEIHRLLAQGENHHLFDRDMELYSRELSEFGDHNNTLIATVQRLYSSRIGKRYENKVLTVWQIISDLFKDFGKDNILREPLSESELQEQQNQTNALVSFWREAAYDAFYNRTRYTSQQWDQAHLSAQNLDIELEILQKEWSQLVNYFRQYLAETYLKKRDDIVSNITKLFLDRCFHNQTQPAGAEDVVKLLICVTFMILGYQRIVPGTRTMIAQGLIKESIISATPSNALRRIIPENILGSFSGVKYNFSQADSTRGNAKNVTLSYLTLMGSPRMLMHRFHELFKPENQVKSPVVLMASATSFLEASPAYHIQTEPNYLLKPKDKEHSNNSRYVFLPQLDRERGDEPLRYSGAGKLRERNLEKMLDALVKEGKNSHIKKQIRSFDVKNDIHRKVALVVNSYEQARTLKKYLDKNYPEIGKRTKALVKSLEEGDNHKDYLTPAQCPVLGDDENCDIFIFPMLAIGRGVNIVFSQGPRKLDAAIGSIYFLTRPHPTIDDLQLLYSLAGEATQNFDNLIFSENHDLNSIVKTWKEAKKALTKKAYRLLTEPFMASRLSPELFKAFTANQMINILQTIGRGMRNGCPVQVFFVDAAWASNSARGKPDSGRHSMLVQMRIILEELVNHPDSLKREIYQELYQAFLTPLQHIEGIIYPDDLRVEDDSDDNFDSYFDESFDL